MPKIDLKTPVWSEGKLYRPGKGVEVPQALYAVLSPSKAPAAREGGGAKQDAETYPDAELLAAGGFKTWDEVEEASDDDLLALDGIGPARLARIRAWKG